MQSLRRCGIKLYRRQLRRFSSVKQTALPLNGYTKKTIVMADGNHIPIFGFGTWGCDAFNADIMATSTRHAIDCGYRHFDCARIYKNEAELGHVFSDAFQTGRLSRDQIFLTSKLYNNEHAPDSIQAAESTLKNLQTDYIDMLMIHWPIPNIPNDPNPRPYNFENLFETWKLMSSLVDQGMVRSLGICNFSNNKTIALAEAILQYNDESEKMNDSRLAPISYSQLELHPYHQTPSKLEICKKYSIAVSASMPLGSPERPVRWVRDDDPVILENPVVAEIAVELGISPAQTILAWHMQRGCVAIPKATVDWMIDENWKAQDLSLNDEQMMRMSSIDQNCRLMRGEVFLWEEGQSWEELWDGDM